MQRRTLDCTDLQPMFQLTCGSGATLMARVSWLEPGIIMKCLDAGAYWVICPMAGTAAQAAECVSYLRYPPLGQRSFGLTRELFAVGDNCALEANSEIMAFAMIETAERMDDLDVICAAPRLDGIYLGPTDLTFGLTQGRQVPALDREEPEMIMALQRIVAACKAAGIKAAGIKCALRCRTPGCAARAVGWGFDVVTASRDSRLLAAAAACAVRFRGLVAQRVGSSVKGAY